MTDETFPEISLGTHEHASQSRFETLATKLNEIKETKMSTPEVNVYQKDAMAGVLPLLMGGNMGGTGAAIGGGLGAGLLGGVLGSALLGNGGILGGRNGNVEGIVTPTMLTTALNQVQDNTNAATAASERLNMARFDADSQRDLAAAIERTAAATQLASAVQAASIQLSSATQAAALGVEIAKGNGEINTQVALTTGNLNTQGALNAAAIQTQAAKNAGDIGVQVALNTAAVATAVERTGTANALAFKDSALLAQTNAALLSQQLASAQYALATATKADGDMTRALIIAQNDAMLNRQLATAQAEIIELRNHEHGNRRQRETEVNVTQTVTQNQNNLMNQQQQQQQFQILANLAATVGNLANDIQVVRQGQTIFNSGTMAASGTQAAANTRVS